MTISLPFSERRQTVSRPAAWVWAALLGLGLIVIGLVVMVVALHGTLLPYDEAFLGWSVAELNHFNPRILPFMEHDRVTTAGTLLSTGLLYLGLALGGMRPGRAWAGRALVWSAVFGFLSFFLFIGHGYLDPLHLLVTALMLLVFIPLLRIPLPAPEPRPIRLLPYQRWGKRLLLLWGVGLVGSGLTIAILGATSVFVPEDLIYLRMTSEQLSAANPRLIPLIAHDRAAFGGAMLANGLGVLLAAHWGFRPGERWLWSTIASSGAAALVPAIWTHYAVGYTEFTHLLPAFAALLKYLIVVTGTYAVLQKAAS